MDWWLWMVVALALAGLEAATPGGFVMVFFAVGALVVGGLAAVGVLSSLGGQGLVFSAVSIVSLLLFRNPLLGKMKSPAGGDAVDSLIGETAVLLDDLAPNQVGKAELRGSSWNARANDGGMLRRGQRCRVERVDGLTLWLRPE